MIQDPEARRLLGAASTALRNIADTLETILNNMEGNKEPESNHTTSNHIQAPCSPQVHGAPLPHFMFQDIDSSRDDYSRGLSGRPSC